MRLRFLAAIVLVLLVSAPVFGQGSTWKVARTPDGQPDLQGVWTNETLTPLERPKGLGAKEFYTEQEVAENEKRERERASQALLGRGTEPGTGSSAKPKSWRR